MANEVDSYCSGCIYLCYVGSDYKSNACDYIGQTGHRRPCPAGKGCTVRKAGKKKPKLVIGTKWGY